MKAKRASTALNKRFRRALSALAWVASVGFGLPLGADDLFESLPPQLIAPDILSNAIAQPSPAFIAIIIDDLGYNLAAGERALALPEAVTVAILPEGPHSSDLYRKAFNAKREIMLHLPMSSVSGVSQEPNTLSNALTKAEFIARLQRNLVIFPGLKGVNNHMGSMLTQQPEPMGWIMEELAVRGLYFVDSRTSVNTIAASVAKNHKIPHIERDVFLDHDTNEVRIAAQFDRLLRIARKNGVALAIGHPHPETLSFLEQQLPTLMARGISLISVSELILKNSNVSMARNTF